MDDRKTRPTDDDVDEHLAAVPDERRRADAVEMAALMRAVTGVEPRMWGSMVGFGRMPYRTADGREREWFAIGLAPRKQALTLYGLTYYGSHAEQLAALGPHSVGKGCVYVKRLADLDRQALTDLVARAWAANHRPAPPRPAPPRPAP